MSGLEIGAKADQWTARGPVALLVVRSGVPPLGGAETAAEAAGDVLVIGSGTTSAARALTAYRPGRVFHAETGPDAAPAAVVPALTIALRRAPLVLLPASPDGRDLAPRLAAALGRPLLAGAARVGYRPEDGVVTAELVRAGGRATVDAEAAAPVVATLLPGTRTVQPEPTRSRSERAADEESETRRPHPSAVGRATARGLGSGAAVKESSCELSDAGFSGDDVPEPRGIVLPFADTPSGGAEASASELVEPSPAAMDLAEAPAVMAGGAGLVASGADAQTARASFATLGRVASRLGTAYGATRVATDAGWTEPHRQIGTTGVAVDPRLYIALGVSGAAQHTGGIGSPHHVVSVNTDPSAPMTMMADLGLVTDAHAFLDELARRLEVAGPP